MGKEKSKGKDGKKEKSASGGSNKLSKAEKNRARKNFLKNMRAGRMES